ncbi:MAG: TonB-dependent receptor, partial [Acidobacteria bacterium]
MRRLPLVLVLAVALALTAGHAYSQQASTGAIAGVVLGPDGAQLPGVTVAVVRPDGTVVRVVSGDHGSYRVSNLPPGVFEVRPDLTGFVGQAAHAEVTAGRVTPLDLPMGLAGLAEEVNVIGSTPRGSVEAPRLSESGARDVGVALSGIAGVWKVRRAGIASDVVLRGYQGENLNVLIDGARLYGACPNNMDHTSFHVDFAEVDRVDVARGPFDMKNQGGLGGAINIVTRRSAPGFHASPRLGVGSFGFVNPSATVSLGNERVAVLAGYSYRASDPYTDGGGREFTELANYKASVSGRKAFEVNTAWGRVDFSPAASHAVQLQYTWQDAGLVLYPYLQMDALYDRASRVNLGYDKQSGVGPLQALRSQAYYTKVSHWMTDEFRVSSAPATARGYSMGTMARTETYGGKIEAALRKGIAGIEVYRRGWETTTELMMRKYQPQYSIPDVALTSFGFYGEFSQPVSDALQIDLGGRVDSVDSEADPSKAATLLYRAYHGTQETSVTDTYPSGKARLAWRALPQLTISGGIGRTVRV